MSISEDEIFLSGKRSIFVTDYVYGVFCTVLTFNTTDLTYLLRTASRVNIPGAGAIQIVRKRFLQNKNQVRAVIAAVNPHAMVEVDFSDPFNTLIRRIFNMSSDQESYLSLLGLDSDGRFIAT